MTNMKSHPGLQRVSGFKWKNNESGVGLEISDFRVF